MNNYTKEFQEGQKVFICFGSIQTGTIIGKGVLKGFTTEPRYKILYDDGTKGDPMDHLIYTSREEYYKERIRHSQKVIIECKRRIKEKDQTNSLRLTG